MACSHSDNTQKVIVYQFVYYVVHINYVNELAALAPFHK